MDYKKWMFYIISSTLMVFVLYLSTPQQKRIYYDVASGRWKDQWLKMGIVIREESSDGQYARLLKQYGLVSLNTDWRIASIQESHISGRSWSDASAGHVASSAEQFASDLQELVEAKKIDRDAAMKHLVRFQVYVASEDQERIRAYIRRIHRGNYEVVIGDILKGSLDN